MKRVAGTIALIVAASLMLASGESFARGGGGGSHGGGGGSHGGGHAGAFHGGGGHGGAFRGGGRVSSFRGSAPLIAPAVRGFRGVPAVRSFPHGHSHFVVGVRGPFFAYPYAYAAPYYYSYPPAYMSAPYVEPGVWYYCPAYQAYYPQVQACPGGWQAVMP